MNAPHRAPYRPGLPPLPERMRALPLSDKGYPVPYFASVINGQPNFQLADPLKWKRCIEQDRCWICGQPLGVFKVFVVGPMGAMNRITSEPPSHLDCAEYAVVACPFLLHPKAKRRELDDALPRETLPGEPMFHNPGMTLLWTTKSMRVRRGGVALIHLGDPTTAQWFTAGRHASREEAESAVDMAQAELANQCDNDPAQLDHLAQRVSVLRKLLPPAGAL